jgi:hypothetical protein
MIPKVENSITDNMVVDDRGGRAGAHACACRLPDICYIDIKK